MGFNSRTLLDQPNHETNYDSAIHPHMIVVLNNSYSGHGLKFISNFLVLHFISIMDGPPTTKTKRRLASQCLWNNLA